MARSHVQAVLLSVFCVCHVGISPLLYSSPSLFFRPTEDQKRDGAARGISLRNMSRVYMRGRRIHIPWSRTGVHRELQSDWNSRTEESCLSLREDIMNIAKILAENLIFLAHSMPPETGAAQFKMLSVIPSKQKNTKPLLNVTTNTTSNTNAVHPKDASIENKFDHFFINHL